MIATGYLEKIIKLTISILNGSCSVAPQQKYAVWKSPILDGLII